MSSNLLDYFSSLKDPRIERKKLHQLPDIIFLAISATISLADGWEAIAEFGQNKLEWLRRFVPLANGVPSHDCIAYVIHGSHRKNFNVVLLAGLRPLKMR